MKSVKIREIAEALRCAKLDLTFNGNVLQYRLAPLQAEMLAELAIRAMVTPTEEMLQVGVVEGDDLCHPVNDDFEAPDYLSTSDVREIWEAMCQEALR